MIGASCREPALALVAIVVATIVFASSAPRSSGSRRPQPRQRPGPPSLRRAAAAGQVGRPRLRRRRRAADAAWPIWRLGRLFRHAWWQEGCFSMQAKSAQTNPAGRARSALCLHFRPAGRNVPQRGVGDHRYPFKLSTDARRDGPPNSPCTPERRGVDQMSPRKPAWWTPCQGLRLTVKASPAMAPSPSTSIRSKG